MKLLKTSVYGAIAAGLMASTAMAGGLDRTTYSPNILFEQGNYIEGSLAYVQPELDGRIDIPGYPFGTGDISPNYQLWGAGAKFDITDRIAVAFQTFEAVGADVDYAGAPNFWFPIEVDLSGRALVGTAKFELGSGFSVYGGLKHIEAGGDALSLAVPGAVWEFERASGTGYIAGVAYSKPEIALRVSLTYESAFDIDLKTTSFLSPAVPFSPDLSKFTTARIPAAWELYFQTGIAPGTLLFGSIRHTAWSDANIVLHNASGLTLATIPSLAATDFSDVMTYNLGIGKALTEKVSVSLSGTYEEGDGKPSTLQPTNGKFTLGVGAKFKVTEQLEWSVGASHTWLGDNETDVQVLPEANFEDNTAWAFGTKVGIRF